MCIETLAYIIDVSGMSDVLGMKDRTKFSFSSSGCIAAQKTYFLSVLVLRF